MGKKSRQKGHGKDRGKPARARAWWDGEAGAAQAGSSLPPHHVASWRPPEDAGLGSSTASLPSVDATELAARLAGLSTVLQRQLARSDAGDGLTRARLSALALLVLGGPRTLGQLAAAERVRPPTMTRLVQAMEAEGLVARQRNPADGRSVIIRATASGEAQLDRGRARQIAPLAESIDGLGRDERLQLEGASDLLGRILREASWEPAAAME
jgi:DNA-binding MarR family transcriptional regulator